MLPFIVTGLVTGAVYGLAAVGLVLTFKTSGIFNFAHGAIATVAAFAFYTLHVEEGLAWPVAALIAIVVVAVVMALALERLGHALRDASLALRVASTVGVLLVLQAGVVLVYGVQESRIVPVFLADGEFELGGTIVRYADLVTFVFAVVATGLLWVFFRRARLGVAMRAVVESPELVELSGQSAVRVRRASWLIGTTFAATSGVLLASLLPLEATTLTLLVVQAFGAAAIGGFTSLPLTFAGGLAIGVVASLCTKWFSTGFLAGLPPSLPFVVLFVVLLVFPRKYLVEHAPVTPRQPAAWSAPARLQIAGGAGLLALLLLVPSFAGVRIIEWTVAVATIITFLSIGLLVRTSGQVSLCHVGFAAIGAAALGHLTHDVGLPWTVALLGSGLIAVPIGALLAIPAIRLTGLYLALATFGFGVLLSYMFYTQDFMFGDSGAGLEIPRPGAFAGDDAFYYLVLGFAVITTGLVIALNRSRLGRLLRGMAESPTALTTNGTSVNVTRVLVFCLSAFLAALAGALAAAAQGNVGLVSYPPLLSLTYLALVIIAIGREPWYAVMAAFALILIPSYVEGDRTADWLQLLFGAAAILYALAPGGLNSVPAVRRLLDRLPGRATEPTAPPQATSDEVPRVAPEPVAPGTLEVEDLTVRFGGLVAVQDVTISAPTGRITGLIGPNGAGKTTTFNACSGLNRPSSGRVLLDGESLDRLAPAVRARRGLGRTFQRMELFDSLSVWDNVTIGLEGQLAGARPWKHVAAAPGDAARTRAAAMAAIESCELTPLLAAPVGTLSTGQRRLVELARCLAGPSRILLLDEPSSGLDRNETQRFGRILRQVVVDRGVGVLLVEHDMGLVMDVCDYIHVLDFGRHIFAGTPEEVRSSEVVQSAYLGAEDALLEEAAR